MRADELHQLPQVLADMQVEIRALKGRNAEIAIR